MLIDLSMRLPDFSLAAVWCVGDLLGIGGAARSGCAAAGQGGGPSGLDGAWCPGPVWK
jgi:hypothetical protein